MAFTMADRTPVKRQLMPTVSLLGSTTMPSTVAPLKFEGKAQTFPSASVTVALGFALTAVRVTA